MTRAAFVVPLLLVLSAPAARAQTPDEPNLTFTIYGGLTVGSALWDLPRQELLAPGGPPPPLDTVSIARRLRTSISAGLTMSYFRSPHLGLTLDISYLGFDSEQRCTGPATYQPDPNHLNEQACTRANGAHVGTSIVGFLAGATYRFLPAAPVQPYLKAGAGLGLLGNSFIETSALVLDTACGSSGTCATTLLVEQKRAEITWVVSLALGSSFKLSQSSRVAFEVRDNISSVPIVTGPRDPFNNSSFPTTGRAVRHAPTFLAGIEILLERRHGRRY